MSDEKFNQNIEKPQILETRLSGGHNIFSQSTSNINKSLDKISSLITEYNLSTDRNSTNLVSEVNHFMDLSSKKISGNSQKKDAVFNNHPNIPSDTKILHEQMNALAEIGKKISGDKRFGNEVISDVDDALMRTTNRLNTTVEILHKKIPHFEISDLAKLQIILDINSKDPGINTQITEILRSAKDSLEIQLSADSTPFVTLRTNDFNTLKKVFSESAERTGEKAFLIPEKTIKENEFVNAFLEGNTQKCQHLFNALASSENDQSQQKLAPVQGALVKNNHTFLLQAIIKNMLSDNSSVQLEIKENTVFVRFNDREYLLDEILKKADLNQIKLDPEDLMRYEKFLRGENHEIKPEKSKDDVKILKANGYDKAKLKGSTENENIDDLKNAFNLRDPNRELSNLSFAEKLAINIYSSDAYTTMNQMLQGRLDVLDFRSDQSNGILKEILLANVVCVLGLNNIERGYNLPLMLVKSKTLPTTRELSAQGKIPLLMKWKGNFYLHGLSEEGKPHLVKLDSNAELNKLDFNNNPKIYVSGATNKEIFNEIVSKKGHTGWEETTSIRIDKALPKPLLEQKKDNSEFYNEKGIISASMGSPAVNYTLDLINGIEGKSKYNKDNDTVTVGTLVTTVKKNVSLVSATTGENENITNPTQIQTVQSIKIGNAEFLWVKQISSVKPIENEFGWTYDSKKTTYTEDELKDNKNLQSNQDLLDKFKNDPNPMAAIEKHNQEKQGENEARINTADILHYIAMNPSSASAFLQKNPDEQAGKALRDDLIIQLLERPVLLEKMSELYNINISAPLSLEAKAEELTNHEEISNNLIGRKVMSHEKDANNTSDEEDEKKNLEDWGEIPMSLIHQSKSADQQLDQKPEDQLSKSEHMLLTDLRSKVDENKIGFSDLENLQKIAALDTLNYSVQTKEDVKFILTFANIQLQELSENKPLLMAQSESEMRKLQNTLIQINDKLGLGFSPDSLDSAISSKSEETKAESISNKAISAEAQVTSTPQTKSPTPIEQTDRDRYAFAKISPIALLDVDMTLIRGANEINHALITALKTQGITKVMLFSTAPFSLITSNAENREGDLTRNKVIDLLKTQGIEVVATVLTSSPFEEKDKPIGTFFNDIYGKLEKEASHLVENKLSTEELKSKLVNYKNTEFQSQMKELEETEAIHGKGVKPLNKGAMLRHVLSRLPDGAKVMLFDDSRSVINETAPEIKKEFIHRQIELIETHVTKWVKPEQGDPLFSPQDQQFFENQINNFKSKIPAQQALKNIFSPDSTGKPQVNQNNLSFELSKLGSLSEKQNFIELAFNHIPKEKPFTDITINNITILKNEYLKLIVTAVQNGEKVDLDAAKNSPLVNFRNSNLPLPAFVKNIQNTGTRNAIDYVINHKNYIETSSNRESQVHLYSEAPNQRVIKIVHDNLPQINAKEQKPVEAEKISYKSLQETFENLSKEMKSFLSRGASGQKEKAQQDTSTSTLLKNSDAFHQKIPNNKSIVNAPNRIQSLIANGLATSDEIAENAKNTHPIMHNKVNQLITDFLSYKKEFGTEEEKAIYKNMTNDQFIERLLTKRPIVFYDTNDTYMLRNGTLGSGNFETVGTPNQKEPLVIKDYLSYDELQISALIGVSTPTHFINKGNRTNNAKQGVEGSYVKSGIYTGIVGARFEKPGKMEYQHMVISAEQNTRENGYGANNNSAKSKALGAFAKFYGLEKTGFPTHEEAKKDTTGKYINVGTDKNGNAVYLNRDVYIKRMRMSIETFLDDANARGEKMNKQADVIVVGAGLGVWAGIEGKNSSVELANLQLEIYRDLLLTKNYQYIGKLNFSWFPENGPDKPVFKDDIFLKLEPPLKQEIKFSKDDPASPLEDPNKFRVAMYAWDSNALSAGNEYWLNKKADSGDGAAAACSTLSELQNPEINPQAFKASNIKVYGNAQDNVYAEKVTESTKIDVVKTEEDKLSKTETKQPEITVGTETEYQKWAKENEEEFNKTLADYEKLMSTASPPRPTQSLPTLNPKEQETVRSIESRVDNAKKALESASGDRTKMIQALDTIRTLRSEIHALKSETENKPLQEKLSTSDSHLKEAIKDTYEKHKKIDNADVAKSKPAEEKPQIIEATPANKSLEQQQKDTLYQTPTLGHTHK